MPRSRSIRRRQAQVQGLDHVPRVRPNQVGRLDVAVDQAALVGVLQPQRRLPDVVASLPGGEPAARGEQLAQVGALDVLHSQIVIVAGQGGVVGEHDVGVRELGGRLHLAAEADQQFLLVEAVGADDLEGDEAVHEGVPGLEDLAHAALPEPLHQQVRPQHQTLGAALQDLVDLEGGEPAAADQFGGQRARVRLRDGAQVVCVLELGGAEQPVLLQLFQKGGGRHGDSHGAPECEGGDAARLRAILSRPRRPRQPSGQLTRQILDELAPRQHGRTARRPRRPQGFGVHVRAIGHDARRPRFT